MMYAMLAAAAAFAAAYAIAVRPWMRRWGSTPEERAEPLPGDDLVRDAGSVTTRAVAIRAAVAEVWPWLVQMGQDRAGFYTHNWVERLLRSGIPDVHELHPEWQQLAVGDLVRTNRDLRGKALGWPVAAIDPGRSLVLRSKHMPVGSYAFVLRPVDAHTTRLIVRDRAAWRWWERPFALLVYEPLHAYMEIGLMQGARQRAERSRRRGPDGRRDRISPAVAG